jgi:aryl-alcohol dehydrogenase-like predicted oxidoreductase
MEYRKLGNSDLNISAIGLGGNVFGPPRLDEAASIRSIHFAQDEGINFIDTAAIYGKGSSETFVGSAIHDRRDKFIIATKFHLLKLADGESAWDRIHSQCETSLTKLRTDYIDLFQIHFATPGIPQQEILLALDDLVKAGKVRYIGTCNYASWRMRDTLQISEAQNLAKFISCQNHYNVLRRHVELETLPFCKEFNFGFLPYFPLSGGFLSGKYQPGEPAPEGTRGAEGSIIINSSRTTRNEALLSELETFAAQRGHSILDLAIAWLLANPLVTSVIAGTSNEQQIAQNIAAEAWRLNPEEKEEIDAIAAWHGTGEDIELDPAAYM